MNRMLLKCSMISTALTALTAGIASAALYTEEYVGLAGVKQFVEEGKTYDFGFDIWDSNPGPPGFTNSSLSLSQDAATGSLVVWGSASLEIEFYDGDSDPEIAHIIMSPWGDNPSQLVTTFDLGDFNPTDGTGLIFTHTFTPAQISAFSKGWGSVSITALQADGIINDFSIKAVRLTVDDTPVTTNPVPEPATLILFGTGLAGLFGVTRKRKTA